MRVCFISSVLQCVSVPFALADINLLANWYDITTPMADTRLPIMLLMNVCLLHILNVQVSSPTPIRS